ncbi:MAG: DegV family protein [Gemmatimonadales bacterium]|nr:DegV family protein [Gemmatimonadales bacterium]
MPAGLTHVDGPRLSRSVYAASDWVAAGREEINRINVFPVPDGDTGTNFSLTLRAVADALRALGDAPLPETARIMARAAVLGARGNSGMMLAQFLHGFQEAIGDREHATTRDIAAAVRRGADRLYASLDDPREGTILTVARESAAAAERAADAHAEVRPFMRALLEGAELSLAGTPKLMAALREAGVVDAGGKGFVRMIEGVVRLLEGDPILPATGPVDQGLAPAALVEVAAERDFQFCTEVLVRGEQLPPANEVRAQLHRFGGSLVVATMQDILKVHIHTDDPQEVFAYVGQWGTVTFTKADDMRAQHRALKHVEQRPVAIVTDSTCDLPDAILDRHHMQVVPLQVVFADGRTYRDRVELRTDEFYRRLREEKVLPTTSQPAPAEFARAYRDGREAADAVVAVLVSSGLSGTYQSGLAAARATGLAGVHVVDSRSASFGTGMLALRAAELAESGWTATAIAAELDRVRRQSGMFLTVDRFDNLLRSGRVSRGRAWLGGLLDVKPILTFNEEGRLLPVDRVRGRERVVPRVLELLEQRLAARPQKLRFGIAHAEAPEAAERLRTALAAAFRPRDVLVGPATGVIGTHVGPGAWAVFYQVEDGTPAAPGAEAR